MKLYTAGPMTWVPQFNYPAFDAMAADLRAKGYEVISPAELDEAGTRATALASVDGSPGSGTDRGETWGDFLARDVKLVADGIDGIAVMEGTFGPRRMRWRNSKGARLELFVAYLCGKPVYRYPSMRRMRFVTYLRQLLRDAVKEENRKAARLVRAEVKRNG